MENDNEQSPQLSNIQTQDSDGKYAITIHHHSNRLMQEQSITTHSALCLQPDLFVVFYLYSGGQSQNECHVFGH